MGQCLAFLFGDAGPKGSVASCRCPVCQKNPSQSDIVLVHMYHMFKCHNNHTWYMWLDHRVGVTTSWVVVTCPTCNLIPLQTQLTSNARHLENKCINNHEWVVCAYHGVSTTRSTTGNGECPKCTRLIGVDSKADDLTQDEETDLMNDTSCTEPQSAPAAAVTGAKLPEVALKLLSSTKSVS